MRGGLTVLGIVIGVAAVILLVSIVQSAGQLVQDQIQGLGTNVMVVHPGSQNGNGVRTPQGGCPRSRPPMRTPWPPSARPCWHPPHRHGPGQVVAGNQNWSPDQIMGVNTSYVTVRNWDVERGDFFTPSDIRSAAKVCVVGPPWPTTSSRPATASAARSASRTSPSRSSACWSRRGRTSSARTRTTSCWPPIRRSRSEFPVPPSTTSTCFFSPPVRRSHGRRRG